MSHDEIADLFDEWADAGRAAEMEVEHGDAVRQVVAAMDIRPGTQCLDLGCGSGWATRLLASSAPGAGAIGVDASPAMVRLAEQESDWTSRARFEVGCFEALDFPDAKFDRAFSMEALYYAVDLDAALSELLRVLKPGGTADVVVDRFAESPSTEGWSESIGLAMHWMGEAEWAASFERAGFTNVRTRRVIDSRGPGEEAEFRPNRHEPDWRTHVERHEAGSLWIHAEKPE